MNIPKYAQWVLNVIIGYGYLVLFMALSALLFGGVGSIFVGEFNIAAAGLGYLLGFIGFIVTFFHREDFYITKKKKK